MKIQKFNFENSEIIQIYINQIEKNNEKVIEEISKIKSQNSNVFLFIGEENDIIKTIKEVLNYEKSKNIKWKYCISWKKKIIWICLKTNIFIFGKDKYIESCMLL